MPTNEPEHAAPERQRSQASSGQLVAAEKTGTEAYLRQERAWLPKTVKNQARLSQLRPWIEGALPAKNAPHGLIVQIGIFRQIIDHYLSHGESPCI